LGSIVFENLADSLGKPSPVIFCRDFLCSQKVRNFVKAHPSLAQLVDFQHPLPFHRIAHQPSLHLRELKAREEADFLNREREFLAAFPVPELQTPRDFSMVAGSEWSRACLIEDLLMS
jgi:hypothetical protein